MSRVGLALLSLLWSDNLQLNLLSKEKQQDERKKIKGFDWRSAWEQWWSHCLWRVLKDVFRLHLGTRFSGSLAVLDDQVDLMILEGFSNLNDSVSLKVSVDKYFSCALSLSRLTDGRQGCPETEFYSDADIHIGWLSRNLLNEIRLTENIHIKTLYPNFYYLMPKKTTFFFP